MLDESGFSLLPTPCKTWAPRGQTPFLYHCFNWPKLAAISAVTPNPHAYLRLVRGTITSPQVIAFVRHLLPYIPGPLFLFWEGLHMSLAVDSGTIEVADRINHRVKRGANCRLPKRRNQSHYG